jgi:hypothetical protein
MWAANDRALSRSFTGIDLIHLGAALLMTLYHLAYSLVLAIAVALAAAAVVLPPKAMVCRAFFERARGAPLPIAVSAQSDRRTDCMINKKLI